jgi:hypothetical protein
MWDPHHSKMLFEELSGKRYSCVYICLSTRSQERMVGKTGICGAIIVPFSAL